MKRRLSLFLTLVAALGGGPAPAADAPRSGAERWRLRPSEPAAAGTAAATPVREAQAEARVPRPVRIVYPALIAER